MEMRADDLSPPLARAVRVAGVAVCMSGQAGTSSRVARVNEALAPAAAARPRAAHGVKIDVHFAVLPALAHNKLPDPVFSLPAAPEEGH